MIFVCFIFSKVMIFLLSCLFIIISIHEYREIMKNKDIKIYNYFPEFVGILLVYVYLFGIYKNDISSFILVISFIISFMFVITIDKKPFIMNALCSYSAIIFVFLGLYTIKIYEITQNSIGFIITYLFSVLISDYVASVVGQKIKKRIFISVNISPQKTLFGSIGHLFSSCLFWIIMMHYTHLNLFHSLIIGILNSIFAQYGDLAISTIKRSCGVKHSSNMFNNYGGVLDRFDSFLFSAPVIYYYLVLICHFGLLTK
jgi:phosphatidate cytidylyltransferase